MRDRDSTQAQQDNGGLIVGSERLMKGSESAVRQDCRAALCSCLSAELS